ncbi:DUF4360 domain-containing protein [Polyangium aurulentum]|uniref:DUF4360 domain-containing protein n=1 Tax=Polyangium aurulentum TaxID=2567896 RepID=UPI0010AE1EE1|nr:DUF4360 domain-containing protein [Polyangium aurulentum]UQA58562.1 DUF4360 domain-containing protein [Polyangium aurulentum]
MPRNDKILCAAAAAAAISAFIAPDMAAAQVAPQIVGFTYAGNGCPRGSARSVYDAVNHRLTVNFDEFATETPPGESKACNVNFVVRLPSPMQISLTRVEYLGYADTGPNVSGQIRRRYKYGTLRPYTQVTNLARGLQDSFHVVDSFPGWSVCANQVTVATTTRIDLHGTTLPNETNEMVVDATQYEGTGVVYTFSYRPCR